MREVVTRTFNLFLRRRIPEITRVRNRASE
jgi:hypothetical protein